MERKVEFYSGGLRLDGVMHTPDDLPGSDRRPAIVLCNGFGGIKETIVPQLAESFSALGYVALRFDNRGFGASEGARGRLMPLEQVEDTRAAVTFMETQPEIDPARIGIYGTSFGGAVAVYAAAIDPRVSCVVATVGIGDGRRWMRSLRRQWEWSAFVRRLEQDRVRAALTGVSEVVSSDEVLVPDPESEAWHASARTDVPKQEFPFRIPLEAAQAVIEFCPEKIAGAISPRPLLLIHVANDDLVPVEESYALFEAAREPKEMMILSGTQHHDIYSGAPYERVLEVAGRWFDRWLGGGPVHSPATEPTQ